MKRCVTLALLTVSILFFGCSESSPARNTTPAVDENGSDTLVFASIIDRQIFAINVDGTGRRKLATGCDPAVSPDGRQIAFCDVPRNPATFQEDFANAGLYVTNADGSGRKQIARLGVKGSMIVPMAPCWSRDGRRIAFSTLIYGDVGGVSGLPTEARIHTVNSDGSNLYHVGHVNGTNPAWSPDGEQLLFTSFKIPRALWVVDLQGNNKRKLADGAEMGVWSPDGRSLVYVVRDGHDAGLYVAQADGSERTLLAGGPKEFTLGPQWSRDGKRLFFTWIGPTHTKLDEFGDFKTFTAPSAVHVIDTDSRNLLRVTQGTDMDYSGGSGIIMSTVNPGDPSAPRGLPTVPGPLSTEERAAVKWVTDVGGEIYRDEKKPPHPIVGVMVTGAKVTDDGLKHLSGLKDLTELSLYGTSVTDEGLKNLAALKKLKNLNLGLPGITDINIRRQPASVKLSEQQLALISVTDAGLKELAHVEQLSQLRLHPSQISDATLQSLREIDELQLLLRFDRSENESYLDLYHTRVTDAGLKNLSSLPQLRAIYLSNTDVTDEGLKILSSLKQIRSLDLSDTEITDEGLKELRHFEQLSNLTLYQRQISDATLRSLREIGLLHLLIKTMPATELNLIDTRVTDVGLKELVGLKKNLTRLALAGLPVTDAGLKELAGFDKLTSLNLTSTAVTDAGLQELTQLKSLSFLSLKMTSVTHAGVKQLLKHLPQLVVVPVTLTSPTEQQ